MDARPFAQAPPALQSRLKHLSHDLQRAKVDLATGKLDPDDFALRHRALDERLRSLEAEVYARLLHDAKTGKGHGWRPKGGAG